MTRAAYVLSAFLGVAIAFALSGCPKPLPPVPPVPVADAAPPQPVDVFTGKVFDCRASIVTVERASAYPDVGACLSGTGVAACLAHQATQYNPATVACVARDQGASANATSLADPTDAVSKTIADAARAWLTSENLGYR